MKITKRMKDLADRLQSSIARQSIGAKEVLIWFTGRTIMDSPEIMIAFRGDALKLKSHVLTRQISNDRGRFDRTLQKDIGLKGTSQYFPYGDTYAYDLFSGIGAMADEVMGAAEQVSVTMMPAEGTPWSQYASPTEFYSAKTRKLHRTRKPKWLTTVIERGPDGDRELYGADFCQLAPHVSDCSGNGTVGSFNTGKPLFFVVSHTLDIAKNTRITMDNARSIKRCGGLLFPSLAAGSVPATNFGSLVLVADVAMILASLRPYKKGRGKWPIAVYETDAWTATTGNFLGAGSVQYQQELTGSPDLNWTYVDDFWSLGPPLAGLLSGSGDARLISSTKKLRTVLTRRAKAYPRELDLAGLARVREQHSNDEMKYAYVEAKSNGIVPMSCFPVAVCPSSQRSESAKFLRAAGWRGKLLTIGFDPEIDLVSRDSHWDYAWLARDAIMNQADSVGRIYSVQD